MSYNRMRMNFACERHGVTPWTRDTVASVAIGTTIVKNHLLSAIPLTMDRNICAKLVSLDKIDGKKEVLLLEINKPVTIGRNPNLCTYVISDGYISNIHCKLYAVHTSTGGVMISCQDFSTNGFTLNGYDVRRSSVLLMDGDIMELPSSRKFKCIHLRAQCRERTSIFEPTPPTQPAQKVEFLT